MVGTKNLEKLVGDQFAILFVGINLKLFVLKEATNDFRVASGSIFEKRSQRRVLFRFFVACWPVMSGHWHQRASVVNQLVKSLHVKRITFVLCQD